MSQGSRFDKESYTFFCEGEWDLTHLSDHETLFQQTTWPSSGTVIFDGAHISKMDTAGAWLIHLWIQKLSKQNVNVSLKNFSTQHQNLLERVKTGAVDETKIPKIKTFNWLSKVGKTSCLQLIEFQEYLAFVGKLTFELMRVSFSPKHIRWNALAATIYTTGYQALPIIALLSFMVGVVISYQMGLQLINYGANIFIVDLLGLSVLREFGPLLTAIMVAGRTGSSFTAQLGIMKINQEIDALDIMGVTPGELLLLPRLFGLVIALPLLTIWADFFGVFGGMVMANNMLGISWVDFLHRFQHEIPLRALLIGIGKAPVFALVIASVGCFQGMQVEGSADSVGKNTTRSVVLGIFFIILIDAAFSVILSKLKL